MDTFIMSDNVCVCVCISFYGYILFALYDPICPESHFWNTLATESLNSDQYSRKFGQFNNPPRKLNQNYLWKG